MGVIEQKPYGPFKMALSYLRYLIRASNGRGHGIHSPFVYELVRNVLMNKKVANDFIIPENHRRAMLHDQSQIHIVDHGAGSFDGISTTRKVSDIAKKSLKGKKYAALLYKLTAFYKWEYIIELGTSLGVTTAYLSLPDSVKNVYTIEGSESISAISKSFFKSAGLKKIHAFTGEFDHQLPELLSKIPRLDMVFVDGNHRKDPTLHYWNMISPYLHSDSCVIFDDIHWSREMEEAWESIQNQPQVTCSIDLFFIGIIFFRKEFREVQHFQIRY